MTFPAVVVGLADDDFDVEPDYSEWARTKVEQALRWDRATALFRATGEIEHLRAAVRGETSDQPLDGLLVERAAELVLAGDGEWTPDGYDFAVDADSALREARAQLFRRRHLFPSRPRKRHLRFPPRVRNRVARRRRATARAPGRPGDDDPSHDIGRRGVAGAAS